MGLLKAGIGAASGVLADQWREYFYCESLGDGIIAAKAVSYTHLDVYKRQAYDGAEAGGQGEEGTGGQPGAEEDPGIQEQKQALYQALQSAQAEVQSANQALEDAQNAYDLACREDAAQEANDANAREAAELGVQDLNVQTEQAESELQKLREYQDSGGKICAEQDCVVPVSYTHLDVYKRQVRYVYDSGSAGR